MKQLSKKDINTVTISVIVAVFTLIAIVFGIIYDDLKKLLLPANILVYNKTISFPAAANSIKPLVIPLTFHNKGYTDGVITHIKVYLHHNNKEYEYVGVNSI